MSTAIQGNLKTLLGVASVSGMALRVTLQGTQGQQPRVNGTGAIAPEVASFAPNASGAISGTLYSTRDAAGTGNGEIEVGGSLTAVWYKMEVMVNGIPQPPIHFHAKNGATVDISNVASITTPPVVTAPTGDTTYARLDGSNTPFNGVINFLQGIILALGKSVAWSTDLFLGRGAAGKLTVGSTAGASDGTVAAAIYQVGGTDTGITRDSAGVIDIGNGTQGSISGGIKAASLALGGGAALTTTARTGTGNLVLATAPTITNSTQDIINQPAATAFVLKDNQGGTRLSIPSGGVAAGTINNTDITGASTLSSISFKTGVTQNSGLKHQRFGSLCSTGTTQGASCTTAVTWTSAFADANYTVSCTPLTPTNTPGGIDIESKAGAGFNIRIFNLGVGALATYATVDCIAIHD